MIRNLASSLSFVTNFKSYLEANYFLTPNLSFPTHSKGVLTQWSSRILLEGMAEPVKTSIWICWRNCPFQPNFVFVAYFCDFLDQAVTLHCLTNKILLHDFKKINIPTINCSCHCFGNPEHSCFNSFNVHGNECY